MPRKYRPPAARRRKTKRPAPYFVEPLAEDGDVAAAPAEEIVSTLERTEEAVAPAAATPPSQAANRATSAATRHISRDYSYVRAEVRRIVLVAGFLIVSLIITSLLRN